MAGWRWRLEPKGERWSCRLVGSGEGAVHVNSSSFRGARSASPESITPSLGYGFRAWPCGPSRNDDVEIACLTYDWLCHCDWPGRPAWSTLTDTVSDSVPPP